MTALKIATEDDAYLIGGGQGTPVNGKCIIKSRLSNFNCRLKPFSPEYNDNQLVAYDHIERDTPARSIEWIKCYDTTSGALPDDESDVLTEIKLYNNGTRSNAQNISIKLKFSDSANAITVTNDNKQYIQFPSEFNGIDITVSENGVLQTDHVTTIFTISITNQISTPKESAYNTELARYIGPDQSSTVSNNRYYTNVKMGKELISKVYACYLPLPDPLSTTVNSISLNQSYTRSDSFEIIAKFSSGDTEVLYPNRVDINMNIRNGGIDVDHDANGNYVVYRKKNDVDDSGTLTFTSNYYYLSNSINVSNSVSISVSNTADQATVTELYAAAENMDLDSGSRVWISESLKTAIDAGHIESMNATLWSAGTKLKDCSVNLSGPWQIPTQFDPPSTSVKYYQVINQVTSTTGPNPEQHTACTIVSQHLSEYHFNDVSPAV